MTTATPLTKRRYVAPFILITSLFFLWAFGVNLNDILTPRFKNAFGLSDFQSSFIQVASFSGYCLAALTAGRLMERIGYKRAILTGLVLCASCALLFVPASSAGTYAFFLLVPATRLISMFGAGSLSLIIVALSAGGPASVWALVLIGFFHSIMFPTIFALSIKNLGPLTKRGSSLQVMAILGGAILPAIMGRISDATNIHIAFIVPLVCYVYILYFALDGYKPGNVQREEVPSMAGMAQES